MKRIIALLVALLLGALATAQGEGLTLEGEAQPLNLMPVTSALGYTLSYDVDSFTLESADGTGDVYWWTATYGDSRFPATYLSLSVQAMSAADVAEGLRRQSKEELAETEREVAGAVCPVLTGDTGLEGESAQSTYVCIPTGEETSILAEMRCFTEGLEGVGARMWAIVDTLQLVPAE